MKFRTLKSALYDLDEIEDWVTEHFGPSIAFDTESELFKTLRTSGRLPPHRA
jgi:plasmid stabilization system protein ParE